MQAGAIVEATPVASTNQSKNHIKTLADFGLNPLESFVARYLSHDLIKKIPSCHRELYDALYNIQKHKKLLVILPRGFAKSKIISKFFLLYENLLEPNFYLLCSQSGPVAEYLLDFSKTEIETNQLLIADFGNQITDTWSRDFQRFHNGTSRRSVGRGHQVRGLRVKGRIVDDPDDKTTYDSPSEQKTLQEWYDMELIPTEENVSDPWTIVVATISKPTTLAFKILMSAISNPANILNKEIPTVLQNKIHRMQNENPDVMYPQYKDYKVLFFSIEDNQGHSIWQEAKSDKAMIYLKENTPFAVWRGEYMNDPIYSEDRKVTEEQIRYYETRPPGRYLRFLGIDPSFGKTGRGDYAGLIIGDLCTEGDYEKHFFVEQIDKTKLPKEELAKWVFNKYLLNNVDVGIGEANQDIIQGDLKQLAELKWKHLDFKWVTHAGRGSLDKVMRFDKISPFFSGGKIWFKTIHKNFIYDELLLFPDSAHDDRTDALTMILEYIIEHPYLAKRQNRGTRIYPHNYNRQPDPLIGGRLR